MLDMISIFLNLLRFDLWCKMWSILENVPCPLENKVYSSAFGWNVLKISKRSIPFNVSFKTCVSLLIFCFDDLSIGLSGVLKIPTIIVVLSISPFMSVSVCLMYLDAPMLGASVQFSLSVVSDFCNPMDYSKPGLPVHHQLPEFIPTHVHSVSDVIQPSHLLSSPSPLAFNLSQHQGLFKWVSTLHQMAKVLQFQLQHQSFQWILRIDLH